MQASKSTKELPTFKAKQEGFLSKMHLEPSLEAKFGLELLPSSISSNLMQPRIGAICSICFTKKLDFQEFGLT